MHNKLLKVYGICILLGILTGIVGSLFQIAIKYMGIGLDNLYAWCSYHHIFVPLISGLISMVLVVFAWLLVQNIAPEASGSGVPEIEGALQNVRPIYWRRLLPVKFFGGVMAISAKMVLGREGPTIQLGGNLAAMLAEFFQLPRLRRNALVAAGAAAGLATAFNAPLAGVLFVIEEMRMGFNFSFTHFKMVAIAAVVATIMLHLMIGSQAAITMNVFDLPSLHSLWSFLILGIIVGFIGLLFNRSLMAYLRFLDKKTTVFKTTTIVIIGALMGVLYALYPATVGGGYEIIEQALSYTPTTWVLMTIFMVRFLTTLLSYGTGVPGGIFAPMLALGTLLGLPMANLMSFISGDMTVHPGMFAVACMGGLFAAAIRAPLTGIVLVVEMTQNYALILPLMVTCLTSTTVMQIAGNPPIYTQLLRRALSRRN